MSGFSRVPISNLYHGGTWESVVAMVARAWYSGYPESGSTFSEGSHINVIDLAADAVLRIQCHSPKYVSETANRFLTSFESKGPEARLRGYTNLG